MDFKELSNKVCRADQKRKMTKMRKRKPQPGVAMETVVAASQEVLDRC